MKLKYFVVDAFANKIFEGNPAAVYILDQCLSDELMQNIAIENNLSETAFAVSHDDFYELRWFTPDREIDLCGHATLATAFVLFNYYSIDGDTVNFKSQSGDLIVKRDKDYYSMDFPSIMPRRVEIRPEYEKAIEAPIRQAFLSRDLFFVLENEETVKNLKPNFSKIQKFEEGVGVIVTANSSEFDFVSRTFFPKLTINEDPVCGSAHSNLIPYWAQRLGKNQLLAYQCSPRGGYLKCEFKGERVVISGRAALYSEGFCFV